ncbi:MAG: hypothetical protein Q9208_005639 [Pyrenodesmia sp. 3 TL-2023]
MEPTTENLSAPIPASASANASLTTPIQASQLAKGDFILIKTHPCKIISKSTSKPGKHGHAKVKYANPPHHYHSISLVNIPQLTPTHHNSFEALTLLPPFKKHTDVHPAHATVAAPIVKLTSYLLLDINDGYLSLWDQHAGRVKDSVRAPGEGEVGAKLERVWEEESEEKGDREVWVTVLATMGVEVVRDVEVVVVVG